MQEIKSKRQIQITELGSERTYTFRIPLNALPTLATLVRDIITKLTCSLFQQMGSFFVSETIYMVGQDAQVVNNKIISYLLSLSYHFLTPNVLLCPELDYVP